MIQQGAVLKTWELPSNPFVRQPGAPEIADFHARPLADHRLHYLQFEGELGRELGSVRRVAAGLVRTSHQSGSTGEFRLTQSFPAHQNWSVRITWPNGIPSPNPADLPTAGPLWITVAVDAEANGAS